SRFSDNIAHELRTPIATLSTQTQVMLNKPRVGAWVKLMIKLMPNKN
ncbi:histidine kinase dimerization/phospho-acceptor domain-containing protein, partial [Pseudoalteromonas sp. SIMBA_153]